MSSHMRTDGKQGDWFLFYSSSSSSIFFFFLGGTGFCAPGCTVWFFTPERNLLHSDSGVLQRCSSACLMVALTSAVAMGP